MNNMSSSIKSRDTTFQQKYILDYGVKPSEIDTVTKKIMSVRCQFCVYVGRESTKPLETRKRKQTSNIQYWKPPYRPELFKKHYENCHLSQWQVYQQLSVSERLTFFENKVKIRSTLPSLLGKTETSLVFTIKQDIVEKIIGDMFFHIDEHGSITQVRALKLFQLAEDGFYRVVIKSPTQFHLVADWIAHGLSFRQVEATMTSIRNRLSVASVIHCINDGEVASIARVICAANLQTLSSLLNDNSVWAFSLANDGSTHYGRSYLDNRIRVYYQGTCNVLALASV